MGRIVLIDSVNRVLRKGLRIAILYRFHTKIKGFKKIFPEYFRPLAKDLEKQHKKYWKELSKRIDLDFLRLYCNYSGIYDYKYIPINIYYAIVEPLLNDKNTARWYSDKNNLDQIIPYADCPESYLKNIRGAFLDGNHRVISTLQAEQVFNSIKNDFIVKPSKYSSQGRGIKWVRYEKNKLIDNDNQLVDFHKLHSIFKQDYLIQEKIIQHKEYAKFNPSSINSVRAVTYRSVNSEEVVVLNCFFKIGRKGKIVDNTASGGLWIYVDKHGKIDQYAYTHKAKLVAHPDTDVPFINRHLPFIAEIREIATRTAKNFPAHRVLGLDIAVNEIGKPKVLEVNILRIRDPQFGGGVFFGSFTDEVRDYCIENKILNDFRVIRI